MGVVTVCGKGIVWNSGLIKPAFTRLYLAHQGSGEEIVTHVTFWAVT